MAEDGKGTATSTPFVTDHTTPARLEEILRKISRKEGNPPPENPKPAPGGDKPA